MELPRLIRPLAVLASCLCLVAVLQSLVVKQVACLQNLRIQVNNENLQSPPYLLDAVERVESIVDQQGSPSSDPVEAPLRVAPPTASGGALHVAVAETLADEAAAAPLAGGLMSPLVREETIEEMLELEPESVLKLSPSSLIESVASLESLSAAEAAPSAAAAVQASDAETSALPPQQQQQHSALRLKSQLPVTGSHLKRPLIRVPSDEEETADSSHSQLTTANQSKNDENNNNNNNDNTEQPPTQGGAKSRVSPSVAEETDYQAAASSNGDKVEKKVAVRNAHPAPPPDTWEPSQVMAGVTNASHVPATVRRQYGHQTRTRITLGGGYQRNKLSSQPQQQDVDGDRLGAAAGATSLERPLRQGNGADELASAVAPDNEEPSRVIEVPERIVVPAGVFKQQASRQPAALQPAASNAQTQQQQQSSIVRKRDARCPSRGLTALEHSQACDKYILCEDGYSSERTCPNGLMYGTRDVVRDGFCVHRWQVVCGDKTMPNPISSPGCRWQNGIFNVQGSPKCTPDFYECTDGVFEVKKCSQSGQVYDDKTKSCRFAEQVGCAQEALAEFRCPADDQTNTYWPFPRYFLNERALIHCVNDKPEIIRCRDHERVDPENLFCVPIDKNAAAAATDETGAGPVEVTARRTPAGQREKGKKVVKVTTAPAPAPVEDDHSNE